MKLFFLFTLFAGIAAAANATIHTITCQNNPSHFLPVSVNALCGDTIHWVWVEGDHIIGPVNSSQIPAGALMWYSPINVGVHSYDYVVTVAGTYH